MSSERKTKEETVTLGPDVREGQHVFGVAHIFASSDDTFIKVTDLSGKETLVRITGENVKRMKRALKYTRWTREDDETLIRCWLNTSKDPIVGDDQSNIAYWKKIANRLNKITGQSRTSNQCKSHWSSTIRFVNHFCDCYVRAKALNPSGWSEDQYVKKAHELYRQEKGKPFTLDHWWEALNNEAKWNNKHTEGSASKKAKTNEHGTYTTASNNCLYEGNINCLQSIELSNEGKSNQKYKEEIASKKAKEDEHGTLITSFHNSSSEGNVNGSQSVERNNEGKSNHKYMEECASKDAKVDEHGTDITSFDNCLSDGNINNSQLIEQNNEGKSNQKYKEESASKITEVDEHGASYITSFENCLSEGNINSSQSIEQNNEGKSNHKHTEESASKIGIVDEHGTYITSFGNCLSDGNINNSSQLIEQNNEGKSNQKYKEESASKKTKADEHGTHITSSDNCLSEGDINSSQLIEHRAAERDKGKDKALENNDFMKDMLQVEKQKLEIQKDLVASKNISTYLKLLEVDTSNMSNDLRVRHEKIVEKFMDKLLDM